MNFILLAALTGCAPQDATVDGDWYAWLAAKSSATVDEGNLGFGKSLKYSCSTSQAGWVAEDCDYDFDYIGPRGGGYVDNALDPDDRFIGGDCPQTNAAGNFNPEDGPCNGDFTSSCDEEDEAGFATECAEISALEFNTWAGDDSYYGMTGEIKPWRTEALLNSEGDLQLTVHVMLPSDEENDDAEAQDFRFNFSIDPNFAPVECLEDENGDSYIAYQDGSNWVDEWSEDEDGNRIFYLNSGAYQVNPNDSDITWYLSNDLLSGFGHAKFAAEEAYSRPGDYGNYNAGGTTSFLAVEDHESPDLSGYDAKFADLCQKVGAVCDGVELVDDDETLTWTEEMGLLGASDFEHKVEKNEWRPIDGSISGLDGWMEVHSSWVRLQTGQTVAEGENVKGDYQILYEGAEGGSRVLVKGSFDIEELRADRWGYEILEDAKRAENKTPFCGGASL
jgi:hypothetical protein